MKTRLTYILIELELQVAIDIFTLKCNVKSVALSCSAFKNLSSKAFMIFRENVIPQIPSYFKTPQKFGLFSALRNIDIMKTYEAKRK